MKTPIHNCRLLAMSLATFLVALTIAAHAAPPGGGSPTKVTVTAAYPPEAYQGEELFVVVTGTGFDAGSTVDYLVTGTTDTSQVDVLMVEFISPNELKTYIRPKENALVTDYDIEVRTMSGRKGKGTTLFRVKLNDNSGRPPPPPPTNTEPLARFWHGFTGNGGTTPSTSRLYVFGGDGGYELDYQTMSDHWYYSVANASWSPAPTNNLPPSPRKHMGFSCGGGLCVVANGLRGPSWVKETWIYTEASGLWSQANCKRYPCPSYRMVPTMAYDSARGYHVLFGGEYETGILGDTFTFSNATQRWTQRSPSVSPPARMWAATAFVAAPVNRVVLFGGANYGYQDALCDMWSWSGTKWEEVTQINANDGPCLMGHSMVWNGARLVVSAGYFDNGNTPNESVWTFEFTPDGKAGTWSYEMDWYSYFQCTGAGVLHPGVRMAYDRPSGSMAFFGGLENVEGFGVLAYDDLSVCN